MQAGRRMSKHEAISVDTMQSEGRKKGEERLTNTQKYGNYYVQ